MSNGHVYLISFEDPVLRKLNPYVKIGMSYDIKKRISGIQTGSPLQLRFFGFIESNDPHTIEHFLHKLLKKERLVGEWFGISSGLIYAIRTRYLVREDCLDELLVSVEDTPETIKINELEKTVKNLRGELHLVKQYAKELKRDRESLQFFADKWMHYEASEQGKRQVERDAELIKRTNSHQRG